MELDEFKRTEMIIHDESRRNTSYYYYQDPHRNGSFKNKFREHSLYHISCLYRVYHIGKIDRTEPLKSQYSYSGSRSCSNSVGSVGSQSKQKRQVHSSSSLSIEDFFAP